MSLEVHWRLCLCKWSCWVTGNVLPKTVFITCQTLLVGHCKAVFDLLLLYHLSLKWLKAKHLFSKFPSDLKRAIGPYLVLETQAEVSGGTSGDSLVLLKAGTALLSLSFSLLWLQIRYLSHQRPFGDSEVTLMRHRLTGSQGSWHWQLWMSNQLPIYWHVRKINLICLGHPKSNCLLLAAKIFLNDPSIARSLTICINPIVFIPIVFKSELSPGIIPAKTGLLRLLASANLIGENGVSYSFNVQGQRFIFFD